MLTGCRQTRPHLPHSRGGVSPRKAESSFATQFSIPTPVMVPAEDALHISAKNEKAPEIAPGGLFLVCAIVQADL
jgi:hypothetical protein